MELIIIIVVVAIVLGGYIFYEQYTKSNEMYEDEIATPIDTNEPMPLQDKTYRVQNRYNNIKQDSRTDALIHVLQKMHFWLVIIGSYCLVKIILGVAVVITKGAIIAEILDILLDNIMF